jgi:hypothetical protein
MILSEQGSLESCFVASNLISLGILNFKICVISGKKRVKIDELSE